MTKIALSETMGEIASYLLNAPSIRLYQTSAFFKDPGGVNQATGFHTDLNQVPLDTHQYLTFWCPLKYTSWEDSVLQFATGSHRDISYKHWYGAVPKDQDALLSQRYIVAHYAPYAPGDCSIHHGWTYHKANPNEGSETREAVTFSYVDAKAKKLHSNEIRNSRPFVTEDLLSYKGWIDDIPDHGVIEHADLPVVFTQKFEYAIPPV
eukprot:CAMPEP_0113946102 /NCGR_PEP_ID=MMETSP1339-20121228/54462_1 /TAXON_ID=94617 /ORGANISM="Fibrocapsa japonica" /LENGTH=206 /DNA_ID=CAMNT_0000952017 /DNA_START=397 /DNA_END=1017 /DNA_ORIENTATION=- /assembly_acc=CAM_ASM_000762